MTSKHTLRLSLKVARTMYVESHKNVDFSSQFLTTFKKYIKEQGVDLSNHITALYWPFGQEASPLNILMYLLDQKYQVALPKMKGGDMIFCPYTRSAHLHKNSFGFYEPIASKETRPTMLIVPLLGFDEAGHRLGYGKGYYDRAIAQLEGMHAVHLIGLAYPCQHVRNVPFEAHDKKLDAVLLPETYIVFRPLKKIIE